MSDGGVFGGRLASNMVERELRRARVLLAGIGLLDALWRILLLGKLDALGKQLDDARAVASLKTATEVGFVASAAYLACAALVFKKPVAATVTALVLWGVGLAIFATMQVDVLWSDPLGVGVLVFVTIGLVSAWRFAQIHERKQRAATATALPTATVARLR
jgi:hypothetical protein